MTNRQTSEDVNKNENLINTSQGPTYSRLNSSILNLFQRQISRQTDRESLHAAFIHSAAILFVLACGACALLAYRILEPFLQSILWSILAGAFLFPCKHRLASSTRSYLVDLEKKSHLLVYGLLVLLPIQTIDRTIEFVLEFCWKKFKYFALILILFFSIKSLPIDSIYDWCTNVSDEFVSLCWNLLHLFESKWMIGLITLYIIAVCTLYNHSWWMTALLNFIAMPIWLMLLIHVSQYLPVIYRLTVLILAISLTIVGLMMDVKENLQRTAAVSAENERRRSVFSNLIDLYHRVASTSRRPVENSTSDDTFSSASSTPYFVVLFWALFTIKLYQFYSHVIGILILMGIYQLIKYSLMKLYALLVRQPRLQRYQKCSSDLLLTRRDVLMPSPFQGLVRFLVKGDQKFNTGLQNSIDYLISALMIVTLLVSVLTGTTFLVFQIHHESIHMIKLTGNLVNETITRHPSFQYILPEKERMGDLMDSAVNNLYVAGRSWITKKVNAFIPDSSSNNKLEEEILRLWDRAYAYMISTPSFFLKADNQSVVFDSLMYRSSTFSKSMQQIWNHSEFGFADFYGLIRDNLDLLRTVLDSVWSNTTLFLTVLSTIFSLLFTGGFALLNFLVSFIVFVTLLFYLLSYSNQSTYPPTEWLNNTLAIGGKNLGQAVNDAVTSVFVASLKIAAFYGLYTYVLHTLVDSNFVFLPVVIASICAVTLKSYWAALPGCLDLWLVQRRPIAALLLLIGQILPVYVVDTAIYSEVKGGGHQYLTALAIAGGVYYRGIEGALIGPIVLCCLLVGVRLYNETMARTLSVSQEQVSETSSNPAQTVPDHIRSQNAASSLE